MVKCLHTLMSMNVMWFGDLRVLYTAFFQGAMIAQRTSLRTLKSKNWLSLYCDSLIFLTGFGLVKPTGTVKSTAALIKRSEHMNLFEPVYKSCYVFIVAILLFMLVPSEGWIWQRNKGQLLPNYSRSLDNICGQMPFWVK